ncbi:GAP family protein [Glycomyces sp. NPDC047010]|uniref:GAP family protein n=1 Tax=Glycomyces sp. NPDC047010 TaxID=3155023 RepID=UPI00340607CA
MDLAMAASLAALALIDSTSFGTLLIPIWLLLAPGRVRAGRMLVYLGTITVFYFAVGMAIVLGATTFVDDLGALLDTRPAMWVQLAVGVGLVVLSFRFDSKKSKEGGGRMARWRERALGAETGPGTTRTRTGALPLVGLALGAATLEVATMLPYLAAIGIVTTAGLGAAATTATMAGYCLVMVVPALVLMTARLVARNAVEPLLVKINDWMTKNAASTTGWIVGIVGFLVARDAAWRLGLLEQLLNR